MGYNLALVCCGSLSSWGIGHYLVFLGVARDLPSALLESSTLGRVCLQKVHAKDAPLIPGHMKSPVVVRNVPVGVCIILLEKAI